MANEVHLKKLNEGVEAWNSWRVENKDIKPDLRDTVLTGMDLTNIDFQSTYLARTNLSGSRMSGANLKKAFLFRTNLSDALLHDAALNKANLCQADLTETDLSRADLSQAFLIKANLSGARLSDAKIKGASFGQASLFRAKLTGADLSKASLFKADLSEADFTGACLSGANLQEATLESTILKNVDLSDANLNFATLVKADLQNAVLSQSKIYGISLWEVNLDGAEQNALEISSNHKPPLTVDNLEVAQLIGLLLHHDDIRAQIETIHLRVVLILGRFPEERQGILGSIQAALRSKEYSSVTLNLRTPGSQDLAKMVKVLAPLSKFVIVDISDEKRIPELLDSVVHYLPLVPIQPIVEKGKDEYRKFSHYKKFRWVLEFFRYQDHDHLTKNLVSAVIEPAEKKATEFRKSKLTPRG